MNTMPTVPALLVDVRRRSIVSGVSGCRYVALSYRFGEAAHFRLDGMKLSQLRHDFSLDDPEILGSLPLTVRHAIALVEALGESHLWTDSLCITHEDPSTLDEQLAQMAAIYSSALLTIVATDGDGTTGILGLPGISEPRKTTQQVVEFGGENLVTYERPPFGRRGHTDYQYHTRGWTYQEYLMSVRKLIFSRGQAYWMCQCCQWQEKLAPDVEINKTTNTRPEILSAGFPDLEALGHILSDYNKRSLTYGEDALPAIAGLLTVLSRTFTGGFLYGLPEMMFDTALGWHWSDTTFKPAKRVPSQSGRDDQDIPTWSWLSWLSWRGPFKWGLYGEMAVKDDFQFDRHGLQETSPITKWFSSGAHEGEPRRKIVSTWYRERERAIDLES
jgi:hypothetical protein